MLGPDFYEKVGGLVCKTCREPFPCKCDENEKQEVVKNKAAFI